MLNSNAKKWVDALRSGAFRQTKEHLKDENGYCCLGVACELYAQETGRGEWREVYGRHEFFIDDVTCGGAVLPNVVQDWLRLGYSAGDYGGPGGVPPSCLAADNDNGKSFTEIADIIESEPKGLFQ